jgi:hypothetical protein
MIALRYTPTQINYKLFQHKMKRFLSVLFILLSAFAKGQVKQFASVTTKTQLKNINFGADYVFVSDSNAYYKVCGCSADEIYSIAGLNSKVWKKVRDLDLINRLNTKFNTSDTAAMQAYRVPVTRTITINSVTYDLSLNREWTISTGSEYTLPAATGSILGGIKIGPGLTIDGAGVVSVSGGAISGGGAINSIAKWTGLTAVGNSIATDDGTTFKIGSGITSLSSAKFAVINGSTFGDVDIAGNGGSRIYFRDISRPTDKTIWEFLNFNSDFSISRLNDANSVRTTRFFISTDSAVGINTNAPSAALDVNGSFRVRSLVGASAGIDKVLTTDLAGNFVLRSNSATIGGSGTAGYLPTFTASNTIGSSQFYDAAGVSGAYGMVPSGAYKFEVNGALGSYGQIYSLGGASGLALTNRTTQTVAWSMYSGSGELNFYDASGTGTKLTLNTNGTLNAAADYSASYSDLSYVTKGWVVANTGGSYTDEMAQDAFAAMASSEFTYVDATPLLSINAIAQSKITGLIDTLANRARLVGGIVPTSQLPASIVGIVTVANFASLPATGAANTIYITTDNNKRWLWTGSAYVELGATPPVLSVNTLTGDVVLTASSVGAAPTTRTISINGTSQDLSANRTYTVNGYNVITDGTTSTTTSGYTTFKFRSADNKLTVAVTDNDATHGDNLLLTVNEANLTILQSQVTGLTGALGAKVATSTTITINGTALDLSANRSWTVGDFSSNTSTSVDGEIVLFSGTGGKTGKRATGTGIVKVTSGVFGTAVAADFPTLNQSTTGTASNVTGTVLIANGGTGQTSASAAFNALSPVTLLGDLITGSGANANSRVAGNTTTTKKFLVQTGNGTISALPAWDIIVGTDMPAFIGGDVTSSAGGTNLSIVNDAVTFAKIQNITASGKLIGRFTASAGDPQEITISTGLALDASGNLTASSLADGDKGDITVSGSGATWTIDAGTVTLAKMANMATASFIGRNTALTGVPEVLSATTVRTMLAINNVDNTSDAAKNSAAVTLTNKTITSLILTAGGTTAGTGPIKFSSGTGLLTAPEAGVFEYDNVVPYFTPTANRRGVVQADQFATIQADFTLASSTTAQSVFTATHDVVSLDGNTTYWFEGQYLLNTGIVTHTTAMGFALAGGATVTSMEYTAECWAGTANAVTASSTATVWWTTHVSGAASKVINVTNVQPWTIIKFKGVLRMNVAGTVTPQITFNAAPTGTNLTKVGSYIKFTPIGNGSVTSSGTGTQWN